MAETNITLKLYDNGNLDCWVQKDDGVTISFDPKQLPGEMLKVMGDALPIALAAKVDAEERAKEAEQKEAEAIAKVEEVAHLIETKVQLDAKDAIIQDLMAKLAEAEDYIKKMESVAP